MPQIKECSATARPNSVFEIPQSVSKLFENNPKVCLTPIEALTINKMCGSGLKAIMLSDQAIRCGDANVILAGGMESMSNSPHLLMNSREGTRLGHSKVVDSLIYDAGFSRYCVPSRRYLQDFTRARSVDEDSLHRVIIFFS